MNRLLLIIVFGIASCFGSSACARSAPVQKHSDEMTIRFISHVKADDATGIAYVAALKALFQDKLGITVIEGEDLDTGDPSGPEVRFMSVKIDANHSAEFAVITFHNQGSVDPPVYLATAGGALSVQDADQGAKETAGMFAHVVVDYLKSHSGEENPAPPAKKKANLSSTETAHAF